MVFHTNFITFYGDISQFTGEAIKYETGKVYRYTYDTKVLFNDHFSRKETKPQRDVGLHLTMEFELMPIFQDGDVQMVKIQVQAATYKL